MAVLIFGEPPSLIEEGFFEESLDFEGVVFFGEGVNKSLVFGYSTNDDDVSAIDEYFFDLGVSLKVGYVLVFGVHDLKTILIFLIIFLVFFLEQCHYHVISFELLDYLLFSVNHPVLYLFSSLVFIYVLIIPFECN